ncbi:MAG: type II toxin-antitoxin system RelE/ParE family toxin [Candidatus Omnitrophica bacterium]|nr:type II toxin-antitoxin system RelE/ParE family toxin [Candidatus Omnitrophota bacterium]
MKFNLAFTPTAKKALKELKKDSGLQKQYQAVKKALNLLSENPRHPGLQTHKYYSIKGPNGEQVFEAYAEQKTPAAYRIFFNYGPSRGVITIFAITQHP